MEKNGFVGLNENLLRGKNVVLAVRAFGVGKSLVVFLVGRKALCSLCLEEDVVVLLDYYKALGPLFLEKDFGC